MFQEERYKILHKLGSGGFSTVGLARDQLQMRYVALKVLVARASTNEFPELEILTYLKQKPQTSPVAVTFHFFLTSLKLMVQTVLSCAWSTKWLA